jgi:hypothetical protein
MIMILKLWAELLLRNMIWIIFCMIIFIDNMKMLIENLYYLVNKVVFFTCTLITLTIKLSTTTVFIISSRILQYFMEVLIIVEAWLDKLADFVNDPLHDL